jgi:hypothetical protein
MMVGLSAAGQPVPGYEKIAVAAERFAARTPAGVRPYRCTINVSLHDKRTVAR